MSVLLFVYGTLKSGFSRNIYMKEQRYLGTAITTPEYGMFAYGGYPALLNKTLADAAGVSAESAVYGEVYEVNDECLVQLDLVEGVEDDLFSRQVVNICQFNLARLPLDQNTFQFIENKQAQAYLFRRDVLGAANSGSFWPRKA